VTRAEKEIVCTVANLMVEKRYREAAEFILRLSVRLNNLLIAVRNEQARK
jgi:hypothetical protein